ncbi:MAG: EAL domain-containing protein [Candidatus Edwardsbacteria bacterium]|nr:EAL domain-containing protein [Candidatus Edwardsbacteria bacterium]
MKLTRFQWYRAGLIFLLAVLIAAGLILVSTTRQLTVALNSSPAKLEILATIGRVRLLTREMEITRPAPGTPPDDPAAISYGNTVKKARAEIAELARQTAGWPVQLERLALLDTLVKGQIYTTAQVTPKPAATRGKKPAVIRQEAAPRPDFSGINTIIGRMEGDGRKAIASWPNDLGASLRRLAAGVVVMVIAAGILSLAAYLLMLIEFSRRRTTERLLRESQLRFGLLIDEAMDLSLIVLDPSGRVVDWNLGAKRMFGYNAGEIRRKHFSKLFPLEQAQQGVPERCLKTAVQSGQTRDEGTLVRHGSGPFPARKAVYALRDDAGRLNGFAAVVQDITEEQRSREQAAKLRLSLERSTDLVVIATADGIIEQANRALLEATGYAPGELVGKPLDILRPPGSSPKARPPDGEERAAIIRKKNGDQLQVSQTVAPVTDRSGSTTHLVVTSRDVTVQKRLEIKLSYLHQHDPLTGLFNRNYFQAQAKEEIERRTGGSAMLIICIDRFRQINDVFGSNAGNLVLMQLADCLRNEVGHRGLIGRLGSDEFGIVLREVHDPGDVTAIVSAVKSYTARRVEVNGRKLFLTLSAGASLHPDDGIDAETLLKNADVALVHAKSSGLNQFRMYSNEINNRMSALMSMEQQLFGALQNNEYTVSYQPYYELTHRRVAGAEALIRWVNRELGTVSPDRFIRALETTGLIIDVGNWVLKAACLQAKKMESTKHRFPLSVNLSPSQFRCDGLVDMVKEIIGQANVDPRLLTMEITESVFVEDLGFAQSVLKQLKKVGVAISIDDFGTGYSSLSYLKKLPVDFVKIDQSFVHDVTSDPDTASIVTSITNMAKSLGLKTIAEGVETEEQCKVLRLLRCDMGQGYFFSPAMNAADFERSLI